MDKPRSAGQFRFVREFDGELIILDDQHDVAHRLDAEAAGVWRACDGSADAGTIAARTGSDPERVRELLVALDERGLLAGGGDTRRGMLRKAVLTGAALSAVPAITSVLVPGPAEAFNSQPTAHSSSSSANPPAGEPLEASSTGSAGTPSGSGSGTTPGGSTIKGSSGPGSRRPAAGHPGGRPGGRPGGPTVAGARNGTANLSAGDVPGVAGGTARPAGRGTLPFTGTNVFQMAAAGTGLIVAGAAARAAAGPAEPAP